VIYLTETGAKMINQSSTSYEKLTLKEISAAVNPLDHSRYFIQIPKFQRSLVWKSEQKLGLIDSIYRGFPIGSLLAFQTGEMSGTKILIQVVDGLQRITTILEYLEEPLTYAPAEGLLPKEDLDFLTVAVLGEKSIDSLGKTLERFTSWMRRAKNTDLSTNFSVPRLAKDLAGGDKEAEAELGTTHSDQLNSILGTIQKVVKSIEGQQVSIGIFAGVASEVPTIFERINSQGTGLSKYDILASTWVNSQTIIVNSKIKEQISARYKVLIDKGYEVKGVDDNGNIEDSELNLFDYLSGLGSFLEESWPRLFSSSSSSTTASPIAFVLASVALGLPVGRMQELPTKMIRDTKGVINPQPMEAALLAAVEQVDRALAPFIAMRMNQKPSSKEQPLHSQNQIFALVLAYLVHRFEAKTFRDLGESAGEEILESAPGHYLFDVVGSNWRGSGDSRLFDTVWDEGARKPSLYYLSRIDRSQLGDALGVWHEEQMTKKLKERSSLSASSKIVLKFAYSGKISVLHDKKMTYEIEHIYPVSVLAKLITKGEEGWPISAPGNLMLLPKEINRIKGKNLLGQILPQLIESKKVTQKEVKDIQEQYLLSPSWNEIVLTGSFSRQQYQAFCNSRFMVLRDLILANLGL
jgi:hypothetical protein